MGGTKRRRKNSPDAVEPDSNTQTMTTIAMAKTDRDGAHRLENIVMDFWIGLAPWTEGSHDRSVAVTALLEGRSGVLSLDGATTATAPTSSVPGTSGVTSSMTDDEFEQTAECHNGETFYDVTTTDSHVASLVSAAGAESTSAASQSNTDEKQPASQEQQPIVERSELFGYWMFLGSHILCRLMIECSTELLSQTATEDNKAGDSDLSVSQCYRRVLCFLCYGLSCALFEPQMTQQHSFDPTSEGKHFDKWDKASTGPTRHWLARLVTTLTAATAGHGLSSCSLRTTSITTAATTKSRGGAKPTSSSSATSPLGLTAVAAATLCLERLLESGGTFFTSTTTPAAKRSNHWWYTIRPILAQLATNGIHANLAQDCHKAFAEQSGDWSLERACLEALQSKIPSIATLNSVFLEVTRHHPPFRIEARVAYRRWVPIVLDWYAQAPYLMLQQARALMTSSDFDTVDPSSLPLAVLAQWLSWMVEWSSRSGARAPTGSFDQFMKQVLLGRKKKKAPDLRDISLSVMYHSIEHHAAALSTVPMDENSLGVRGMINDQDWDDVVGGKDTKIAVDRGVNSSKRSDNAFPDVVAFYPFMAQLLSDLARVAGDSDGLPYSVEHFENTAAAIVLQQQIFRDANLLYWTLTQVYALIGRMDGGSANYDHLLTHQLVSAASGKHGAHILMQSSTGIRKRKTGTEASTAPAVPRSVVYDRFALFLRAMHDNSTPTQNRKTSPTAVKEVGHSFIGFILNVIEGCLDTRTISSTGMASAVLDPNTEADTKKSKTETQSATATRRSKRRKKEEPEPISQADTEILSPELHAQSGQASGEFQTISEGRCLLASVALDILQQILDEKCVIRQKFSCLGPGAVRTLELKRIIQLGIVLDTVLLRTRCWDKVFENSSKGSSSLLHNPISSGEKRLWDSHMNVAVTAARGKAFLSSKTSLTGRRLTVFKMIANSSKALVIDREGVDGWPLWLPTSHWLLVASNIGSEAEGVEAEADSFIVDGVLASFKYVLSNVEVLLPLTPASPKAILADPEIPLSLQDAQLFLGALVRLNDGQRSNAVAAMAKMMCTSFKKIAKDAECLDLIKKKRVLSGFLARLVTTCTHAAVFSNSEEHVRHQVLQMLNCVSIGSPSFWLASEGYYLQGHFMGILSDRESSLLPDMTVLPTALDPETANHLRQVLEVAFEIGLLSAPEDSGFLMFSAWNALGKAAVWDSTLHTPPLSEVPTSSPASAILALRENVCFIYHQLLIADEKHSHSTIARAYHKKVGASPNNVAIVENLRLLIESGSVLIESLLAHDDEIEQHNLSGEDFALLEALCVALSFAVSSITKQKPNILEDMVANLESKRPRGYSTESEAAGSDGESGATEDARVEVLERIEICVSRMGGAPTHPDWLDTSCSLRSSISMDEAQWLGLRAMDVMSRVVNHAKLQQQKSGVASMQKRHSSGDLPIFAELAFKMLIGSSWTDSSTGGSYMKEVAIICNVEPKVLQCIADNTACLSCLSALATWCSNSAQRVLGPFHVLFKNQMIDISELGLGEMRVGEEWEVGLSFALTSACAGFSGSETKEILTDGTCATLIAAGRWERLTATALSCLVPISALVRYTEYKKGRKQHPFSKLETCPEDYQFVKTYLPERMPPGASINARLTTVVEQAVRTLTIASIYSEPTAELIAANLFVDPLAFIKLRSASLVRSAVKTLAEVVTACSVRGVDSETEAVVERLVRTMIKRDHNGADRTSGIVKFFFSRTVRNSKEGCLISGGGMTSQLFFSDQDFSDLASTVISFLWNCSSLSNHTSRRSIIVELGNLASMAMQNIGENKLTFYIHNWLTSLPHDRLTTILENDIFDAPDQVAVSFCAVLSTMFQSNPGDRDQQFESTIFGMLLGLVRNKSLKGTSTKDSAILNVLFLCGTCCEDLGSVARFLVENVKENLNCMEMFVAFLRDLHFCLYTPSLEKTVGERNADPFTCLSTSCSYALKEGFYEQHWYNCKTCGLTDEKGCCSLCALVCHQGHDVSYARFSSFFCDCGAQNGVDGVGTFCRCLSPISRDEIIQAHRAGANRDELEEQRRPPDVEALRMKSLDYAAIAASSFRLKAVVSLGIALSVITNADLSRQIESVLVEKLKSWKIDGLPFPLKQGLAVSFDDVRLRMLRSTRSDSVILRVHTPLLSLVSSYTRGSLNLGICVDSSIDRKLRMKLLERGSTRSVVAADSRGRLFIAETAQVTMLSGGSIPENALDGSPLERRTLPIICSKISPVKSIHGILLNSDNEKHVLLWGAEEACIIILNSDSTFADRHIDLDVHCGFHSGESDNVVTAGRWFPSSETHVSVGSGSSIRAYSLCRLSPVDDGGLPTKVSPDFTVFIHPSLTLKDYCIVQYEGLTPTPENACWRIFALLSDGSIHSVEVYREVSGLLMSPTSNIGGDGLQVLKLSDEEGLEPGGRFSRIKYLPQSRTLICQASGGKTTALVLDETGCIKKRFELIPECLIINDYLMSGPYNHFTELGLSRHDGTDFFRLVCTTAVANPKGHVVLSVEFNDKPGVRIGIVGTLEGESSIDGAAAFSVPCAETDDDEMNLSSYKAFVEKILVCVVESDGRFVLFCDGSSRTSDERLLSFSRRVALSKYPLLAFENLSCLSNSKLLCHVDGCSSSDLSSKLQRDSDSFFLSPRRDGFTLSIAPRQGQGCQRPVLAALRLLVGKTSSSCVPHQVYIGGRAVKLQQGIKKWYSVVMTADEIALALRNGFVTVTFTQPIDSTNNPILDALDVYCIERNAIQSWLPQKLCYLHSTTTLPCTVTRRRADIGLLSAVNTLTSLQCILRPSCSRKMGCQIVSDLISQTCLACPNVATAVEALIRLTEPETAQQLLDKSRLVACVEFLSKCPDEFVGDSSKQKNDLREFWRENRQVLQDCLELASCIARQRPMNYTPSLDGTTKRSIASLALVPVTQCLSLTLDYKELVGTFVEVCLLEMAVAGSIGYDQNKRGSMGNFAPLRALLTQRSSAIVKPSCDAISKFCAKYSSPLLLENDFDFFHSSRIMTFACDCCQLTPIRGVRYSLLDDHRPFDLCNKCHELAMKYASEHNFSETSDVIIEWRKVGDPKLTCAEVGRMQSVLMQDHPSAGTGRQQLFDVFLDGLFNGLVALVGAPGKNQTTKSAPVHLIHLVVGLVDLADSKRRVERKKRIAKELCFGVSLTLRCLSSVNDPTSNSDTVNQTLEQYFSSLCQLVVADPNAREYLTGKRPSGFVECDDHHKIKAESCGSHGGKPMCKKATDGVDKFYVCSQEKCNFFVWAHDRGPRKDDRVGGSEFDNEAAKHVWKLLTSCSHPESTSLHTRICTFLESGLAHFDRSGARRSTQKTLRTYEEAYRELLDGVHCSKELLFLAQRDDEFVARASLLPLRQPAFRDSWVSLIESCLELLCLAAAPDTDEGVTAWFPVLCSLLMEEKHSLRSLAKTAVFRLCGRNSDLYFAVRDHHAFGTQMKKVVSHAWPLITQAVLLKERARQCSTHWKENAPFSWDKGGGFEFVGLQLLVAEDTLSLSCHDNIRKQLNEMLASAKKRGGNWRRFCRLKYIERPKDGLVDASPAESKLLCLPPIRALLYLACVLPPDCQARVMKLIDLGTPPSGEAKAKSSIFQSARSAVLDFVEPKNTLFGNAFDGVAFSHQELCDYSVHFVLRGVRSELRRSAGNVGAKLCSRVESQVVENVVKSLTYGSLGEVGEMGKGASEFLTLISNIVGAVTWPSGVAKEMAAFVETIWSEQFMALRHDRANNEYLFFETRSGQTTQKKRFDLSPCFYCHCSQQTGAPGGKRPDGRACRNAGTVNADGENVVASSSKSVFGSVEAAAQKTWLSNQVSPFVRGRLESIRDAHASSEFALYLTLKYRLALSDISVEVQDLRTRFVKTIKVYASTRVVDNVVELKSGHKWQEVATLSLSQGGTRANCSLDKPVLAANLKIEYCDFFDRPGGSRASDGTLLIHCPRCARVVNNAHGVCGNCGEVAFQCRKCRHINYDRLDAFLCVECGYCASGSFVFEINAGIASNAAAIRSEQDYRRAQRQLELSTRLYSDILRCFRDQYVLAVRGPTINVDTASMFPTEELRVAYGRDTQVELPQGALDMTPEVIGKQGSVVKAVARPSISSEPVDHYRSVLLLARSSPSIAGSSRRRSRDIIIRHVGRDLQVDDEESDLIGLLESTDSFGRVSGLDPTDPLSRLLASVQSRREQNLESRSRKEKSSEPPGSSGKSAKVILEVCDKLHVLLREAERETYQLKRRIGAWQCLHEGRHLDSVSSEAASQSFVPSHCWACAGSLAGHLLLLWVRLFQADPYNIPVKESTVRLLLQDDLGTPKSLLECKRLAVSEVALKSEKGASLILDMLRLRLRASQDVNAAEMLGQIVAAAHGNSALRERFVCLAKEQLEANYCT
ncbi:hypothetical protein ACA910_012974 [Epithemia clementina (nom. ined.)]